MLDLHFPSPAARRGGLHFAARGCARWDPAGELALEANLFTFLCQLRLKMAPMAKMTKHSLLHRDDGAALPPPPFLPECGTPHEICP